METLAIKIQWDIEDDFETLCGLAFLLLRFRAPFNPIYHYTDRGEVFSWQKSDRESEMRPDIAKQSDLHNDLDFKYHTTAATSQQ